MYTLKIETKETIEKVEEPRKVKIINHGEFYSIKVIDNNGMWHHIACTDNNPYIYAKKEIEEAIESESPYVYVCI